MKAPAAVVVLFAATMFATTQAEAQPAAKVSRVGVLTVNSPSDVQVQRVLEAFRQGLEERGWTDGKNIVIEYRSGEGHYERLPGLTADLVRLEVAVIVGGTTPVIRVVQDTTKSTPVVMVAILDPIGAGFVSSLARPGGNITGLTPLAGPEIIGKQLQLLKQMVPSVSRVAVLANPRNGAHGVLWKEAEHASPALQFRAARFEARDANDLERAFEAMKRERCDALLVLQDAAFFALRDRIAELAARHRLPAMYGLRVHVDAGGLVVYGASLIDQWRRAADYVDRILKGAKPAEMPVEQPSKFELVINMKTAKVLGLTIPPALLLRADQIIE